MKQTDILTKVTQVNGWVSRLHKLHESKLPFVSRIEFIRSKLPKFSTHISGVYNKISTLFPANCRPPCGLIYPSLVHIYPSRQSAAITLSPGVVSQTASRPRVAHISISKKQVAFLYHSRREGKIHSGICNTVR